jgi:hypothetical protein
MIVRVFAIWILMLGLVKAQVPLPYITSFGLADQPNIRQTSSGGTEQHISLVDPSGRIIRQFAVGEEGYELQLPPGIFFVHTPNGTRRKLVVF